VLQLLLRAVVVVHCCHRPKLADAATIVSAGPRR
jgi:hypothetical protein